MRITDLPQLAGAFHRRKRVGRGIGSGHGKTSTRGQKGQRARTGSSKRPGFEGGHTPLIRRLPKRGFRRKATGQTPVREVVNLERLNRLPEGERVTPQTLEAAGLIRDAEHQVKLLGEGTLTKRLTVLVHAVSQSAQAKITQAGGTVEFITSSRSRGGADRHVSTAERAR